MSNPNGSAPTASSKAQDQPTSTPLDVPQATIVAAAIKMLGTIHPRLNT
jgi:hypothetical protein